MTMDMFHILTWIDKIEPFVRINLGNVPVQTDTAQQIEVVYEHVGMKTLEPVLYLYVTYGRAEYFYLRN